MHSWPQTTPNGLKQETLCALKPAIPKPLKPCTLKPNPGHHALRQLMGCAPHHACCCSYSHRYSQSVHPATIAAAATATARPTCRSYHPVRPSAAPPPILPPTLPAPHLPAPTCYSPHPVRPTCCSHNKHVFLPQWFNGFHVGVDPGLQGMTGRGRGQVLGLFRLSGSMAFMF